MDEQEIQFKQEIERINGEDKIIRMKRAEEDRVWQLKRQEACREKTSQVMGSILKSLKSSHQWPVSVPLPDNLDLYCQQAMKEVVTKKLTPFKLKVEEMEDDYYQSSFYSYRIKPIHLN